MIFEAFDTILFALGAYFNDPEAEMYYETRGDRHGVTYKDYTGTYWQSVEGDGPFLFFVDVLKLLLKYNYELRKGDAYHDIKVYIEGGDKTL